jgi:hypothetical protein
MHQRKVLPAPLGREADHLLIMAVHRGGVEPDDLLGETAIDDLTPHGDVPRRDDVERPSRPQTDGRDLELG